MKNRNRILMAGLSCLFGICLTAGSVWAGEITYNPVNPNFGGNPFNAAPLLSAASAQNDHEDPNAVSRDFSQSFQDKVDSLILSSLARAALGSLTDDSGNLVPGTFDTGLSTITITDLGTTLEIKVVDNATGDTTTVVVPN